MFPEVKILGLYLYDIFFVLGIIAALPILRLLSDKSRFSAKLFNFCLFDGIFSIACGYGSAVLFQAFYNFLDDGKFELAATTGATFYGGLIGGALVYLSVWFIGGKIFLKGDNQGEEKRKFKDMLDIAACCIPLAHGIGRIGCFFAGCCHGKQTDAWFGVNMYTEDGWKTVVPVQLFEAIFLFILAGVLLYLFFKRPNKLPLMPFYCGFYGIWRFFIEYARADDRGASFISFLSPSQLTSLLLLFIAVIYLSAWFLLKNKSKKL